MGVYILMKTSLLPFLIIGLVGLTAVGGAIYVMKGSAPAPTPPVATTEAAPPPSQPAATPPPLTPAPDTADQSPPPPQTAMTTPPPTPGPGNGQPGQGGRGAGMQRMYDQLGLTDAQKQQIAQIRADTTLDRNARREAIRNVMTPAQQAQMDQLREQMRAQFGNRGGGGNRGGDNNNGGGGNGQGGNAAPAPATAPEPAPATPPPANPAGGA